MKAKNAGYDSQMDNYTEPNIIREYHEVIGQGKSLTGH